jgi:hypothetical protein
LPKENFIYLCYLKHVDFGKFKDRFFKKPTRCGKLSNNFFSFGYFEKEII